MQLQSDIANKVNPLVTKHAGMYPRRQRTDSKSEVSALDSKSQEQSILSPDTTICECTTR